MRLANANSASDARPRPRPPLIHGHLSAVDGGVARQAEASSATAPTANVDGSRFGAALKLSREPCLTRTGAALRHIRDAGRVRYGAALRIR